MAIELRARHTLWFLAAAVLLIAPAACKRRPKSQAQTKIAVVLPASTIAFGDPQYAPQLLNGFYQIEESWRWTKKSFAVRLAAPPGSSQRGAQLELRFGIPDPVIQKLNSIALSASVGGLQLASQRYEKSGQFTYKREIPADRLQANPIPVEFTLDRALPPSDQDKRELGIVVTEVGLTAN